MNSRPFDPQSNALTRLRYIPTMPYYRQHINIASFTKKSRHITIFPGKQAVFDGRSCFLQAIRRINDWIVRTLLKAEPFIQPWFDLKTFMMGKGDKRRLLSSFIRSPHFPWGGSLIRIWLNALRRLVKRPPPLHRTERISPDSSPSLPYLFQPVRFFLPSPEEPFFVFSSNFTSLAF